MIQHSHFAQINHEAFKLINFKIWEIKKLPMCLYDEKWTNKFRAICNYEKGIESMIEKVVIGQNLTLETPVLLKNAPLMR